MTTTEALWLLQDELISLANTHPYEDCVEPQPCLSEKVVIEAIRTDIVQAHKSMQEVVCRDPDHAEVMSHCDREFRAFTEFEQTKTELRERFVSSKVLAKQTSWNPLLDNTILPMIVDQLVNEILIPFQSGPKERQASLIEYHRQSLHQCLAPLRLVHSKFAEATSRYMWKIVRLVPGEGWSFFLGHILPLYGDYINTLVVGHPAPHVFFRRFRTSILAWVVASLPNLTALRARIFPQRDQILPLLSCPTPGFSDPYDIYASTDYFLLRNPKYTVRDIIRLRASMFTELVLHPDFDADNEDVLVDPLTVEIINGCVNLHTLSIKGTENDALIPHEASCHALGKAISSLEFLECLSLESLDAGLILSNTQWKKSQLRLLALNDVTFPMSMLEMIKQHKTSLKTLFMKDISFDPEEMNELPQRQMIEDFLDNTPGLIYIPLKEEVDSEEDLEEDPEVDRKAGITNLEHFVSHEPDHECHHELCRPPSPSFDIDASWRTYWTLSQDV